MLRYKCKECKAIFAGLETECPLCGSKRIVIIPQRIGINDLRKFIKVKGER